MLVLGGGGRGVAPNIFRHSKKGLRKNWARRWGGSENLYTPKTNRRRGGGGGL